MKVRCQYCAIHLPATAEPPVCKQCVKWDAAYERHHREAQQGGEPWNTSRDDPWQRDWLTSRELFVLYRQVVPRLGARLYGVLDGEVFEYGRGTGCWVQAWVSPTELIVAYPTMEDYYSHRIEGEGLHEFEGWVAHLRRSDPLELGQVRGRSSYGATLPPGPFARPRLGWGQYGDWAGLARHWWLTG
jgi:hypothetical protein